MPSDSALALPAGFATRCARAFVAAARAHHVVAAARSGLGPANSNAINTPGRGVTEVADLVRAKVRDVLRALEVDTREYGYQQGFAGPTTVYRRQMALGVLRAVFLTLWRRAAGMLAGTGRPQLRGDDNGFPVKAMSPMYSFRIFPAYEAQVSALVFVLARDEAHLDG